MLSFSRRTFIGALAMLALSAGAFAQQLTAGKDFQLINPPRPMDEAKGSVEVLEYFWYSCGHCYRFEPTIDAWVKSKPAGVKFKQVPLVTSDGIDAEFAKLHYALEAMGKLDTLHIKLFDAFHRDGVILNNRQQLLNWAGKQGVDAQQVAQVMDSFGVASKVQRARQLAAAHRISSTPTVVINGKYSVSNSGLSWEEFIKSRMEPLITVARNESNVASK